MPHLSVINLRVTGCVIWTAQTKKLYSINRSATKYKKELNCEDPVEKIPEVSATISAKATKAIAKNAAQKQLHQNWSNKALHGKFSQRCTQADVDKENTFSWLKSSGMKPETEGFIIAAQDQSLQTNNYKVHIQKTGTNAMCRYCREHQETIDHLVSGCPTLAINEYLIRHNKVAQYVHWKVCQHFDLKVVDRWYEHQTPPVTENEKVAILWDFPIQTDRTIKANRPDIIIRDKIKRTCLLIDVSIPADKNTSLKNFEKLSKYKDLEIELGKSWNMKMKTVPIIVGALGVINRSFKKYLQEVPGKLSIHEIQKITLLGTAHILRKALSLNTI